MDERETYVRFASANPVLDFSFLYPSNWSLREVAGEGYEEVAILGPRNEANRYSLGLMVRVSLDRHRGGRPQSLKEFVDDYLVKANRLAGFQEISRAQGSLANLDAIEVEFRYVIPLPLNTVNPISTSILERRIFFLKGNRAYQIIYGAVEEDYRRYLTALRNAVRTFEFGDETVRQAHRPLVTSSPAHAMREDSTEYKADE